jgi:hypothetical protein
VTKLFTLKLDAAWQPIEIIDAYKGFSLVFSGRARVVEDYLTLDHVTPKSRGGQKSWENLVACCVPCNQRKGDKTPSEASMSLSSPPREPSYNLWSSVDWMLRKHGTKKIPDTWEKFLGERYERRING